MFIFLSIIYSGLPFDSSYILPTYSEISQIDNNCIPPKKVIVTINDVQPGVKWFKLNANEIKA